MHLSGASFIFLIFLVSAHMVMTGEATVGNFLTMIFLCIEIDDSFEWVMEIYQAISEKVTKIMPIVALLSEETNIKADVGK